MQPAHGALIALVCSLSRNQLLDGYAAQTFRCWIGLFRGGLARVAVLLDSLAGRDSNWLLSSLSPGDCHILHPLAPLLGDLADQVKKAAQPAISLYSL
ncbi:hypothetical protein AMS68_005020 [Peltaster fructicola]|uniref:Uncharacterized protein n=1 Tax=Peltaster fructicola TaxID=286661 RepID=A0A6H0XXM3_9PEZI|nr:hypothetical protein AMS68_005020 [Peltaster fructicola]